MRDTSLERHTVWFHHNIIFSGFTIRVVLFLRFCKTPLKFVQPFGKRQGTVLFYFLRRWTLSTKLFLSKREAYTPEDYGRKVGHMKDLNRQWIKFQHEIAIRWLLFFPECCVFLRVAVARGMWDSVPQISSQTHIRELGWESRLLFKSLEKQSLFNGIRAVRGGTDCYAPIKT